MLNQPSASRIPFALNVLGSTLPIMTFIYGFGLIVALAFGAKIGEAQVGLVVALALILGVLVALTCAVVFWFVGSSLGSWTKNFVPLQGAGGSTEAPVQLPVLVDTAAPSLAPSTPTPGAEEPDEPEPEKSAAPDLHAGDDKFARVHAVIAKEEGGYSNDPDDSGGPTNFGITQATLAEWRGKAVTASDVEALTYAEALLIFRARYWTPLRCDDMQIAVALMTYNAGVNSGIGRGAKFLQECLNRQGAALDVDGEVGPLTLAAARKADVNQLVADYAVRYEAFYRQAKGFAKYGKGWLNRLKRVTAQAEAWAAEPLPAAVPLPVPADAPGGPPWLARAIALRGLYEHAGAADNPVILEMARVCGGKIAKTYVHDAIAWCALFVNYCLVAAGQPGNDSLWALDFANYGRKLPGPAVGAIACKKRDGGGHVFIVIGRDSAGRLVGIGGNQSDMVCDDEFDAEAIVAYTWPDDYPLPAKVGASKTDVSVLPMVKAVPMERRDVELPA